jgi:hypothetical protein
MKGLFASWGEAIATWIRFSVYAGITGDARLCREIAKADEMLSG